jgi:hypothetical protein
MHPYLGFVGWDCKTKDSMLSAADTPLSKIRGLCRQNESCWPLAAGCRLLAGWLLAVDCWLLAACCWLLVVCRFLPAAESQLLAAGCWLMAADCLPAK